MNIYELMDICKSAGIQNPLNLVQLDVLLDCHGDTDKQLRKTVRETFKQVNDMSAPDDKVNVNDATKTFMGNWDKWMRDGDTHALLDVLNTVYGWTGYSWLRHDIDALSKYHQKMAG